MTNTPSPTDEDRELIERLRVYVDEILPATGHHEYAALVRNAADRLESLLADRAKLEDPTVVHINMLRGGIAKPSVPNIWHLYGERALLAEAPEHIRAALNRSGQYALDIPTNYFTKLPNKAHTGAGTEKLPSPLLTGEG